MNYYIKFNSTELCSCKLASYQYTHTHTHTHTYIYIYIYIYRERERERERETFFCILQELVHIYKGNEMSTEKRAVSFTPPLTRGQHILLTVHVVFADETLKFLVRQISTEFLHHVLEFF